MSKRDFQNWSKDKLLHEYKELLKRKKFGIVWEDRPEDVAEQCKTSLPVLKEEKKRDISSDKSDVTHIMIEADNYHALSVLNYTHKRKIDLIYIDPPYNTGNKSWMYNNHYVEKDDRYRHSKWLSFMSKRLRLAKKLLKENGALICAIDDYELNTLGLLLDEIFPTYEVNIIIVEHHPQGAGSITISRTHEYAYVLTPKGLGIEGRAINSEEGRWSLKRSGQGENNWRENRPNQFFSILIDSAKSEVVGIGPAIPKEQKKYPTNKTSEGYLRIYPLDKNGDERVWRYNRNTMSELIKRGAIEYTKKGALIVKKSGVASSPIFSVWRGSQYNAGTHGTGLIAQILGKNFPYPKSLHTVREMISMIVRNRKNAIVLDFFAGSGTTGHAVLELNKEDEGNRQFILCTNNEDNNGSGTKIASDICYPRIKNVMRGYKVKTEKVSGLGGNLKYFSTAFVDNVKTDNDKRTFTSRCTEMLCLAEGTFDDVINKKGAFAIYENQKQITGIIYDEDAIADFKKEAKKYNKPFVVYVFSYDHTYNEEDFEGLENLRMVKPIPEVILNVYRKIYKELYKPRHL